MGPSKKYLLLFVLILLLTGCSTKKNSFTRRFYHRLTTHYNGYWNGNESFKSGVRNLETNIQEDYNKVLPVFNYGTPQQAQNLNPDMDRAIQKASIMIQRHSMEFSRKEVNKWIDDCYLLIGKSYFYKQEYVSARRTFNFIIDKYDYGDLKHESMIWLARTYNQMEEYEKAEGVLNLVISEYSEGDISKQAIKDLPLVYANYYILQEKYTQALSHLYDAVEVNSKKQLITRLKFIMAQIYQLNGDKQRASDLYTEVIKRNPVYEMSFQAKINLAMSFDEGTGNYTMIEKTLKKMLKDSKNEEFRDQIYYALGDIALKTGNDTLGVHYLKLSVATSVQNNYQKATSSLRVANIFFERPDYQNAQAYFDTAVQVLPLDYPEYSEIKRTSVVLNSLIGYLTTIQTQDSLQRLANMDEDERLAIIDGIIEQRKKEEEEAMQQQMLMALNASQPGEDFTQEGGQWYFYNAGVKGQGYSEFVKKWGRRENTDLWRLTNKQLIVAEEVDIEDLAGGGFEIGEDGDTIVLARSNNPHEREYYLQNLPMTEEKMDKSNELMEDAFFNSGLIYKEGLNDPPKALETFETLVTRFPDNDFLLKTYYHLYKLYQAMPDLEQAEKYKNLILENYPDSDFARVIEDPEYFEKIAQAKNEAQELYEDTYEAYENGLYYLVINYADKAIAMYDDSLLMPRFHYLRALSIGAVEVEDSLTVALQYVVDSFPGSDVRPMAMEMLKALGVEWVAPGFEEEEEEAAAAFPYTFVRGQIHMFVIVVDERTVNLNALRTRISDYNKKFYSIRKLRINSILLDETRHLVTVGNFNGTNDVMDYYDGAIQGEYIYGNLSEEQFDIFVISTSNYPIFYREKNVEEYVQFFNLNYKPGN